MSKLDGLKKELAALADSGQAKVLQGFFKTGPGEYGEGDIFLGIKVPIQRKIAQNYQGLNLSDLRSLLKSGIHEHRLIALIILVDKYKNSGRKGKEKIFNFYRRNLKHANNWDLVDLSAPRIMGDFLSDKPRDVLYKLSRSDNLWERRASLVSTLCFIRQNDFYDIIKLARALLTDEHNLIHKAAGWMLRELGKRDRKKLIEFLDKNFSKMPRIMLRYAIERLDEKTRKKYLCK